MHKACTEAKGFDWPHDQSNNLKRDAKVTTHDPVEVYILYTRRDISTNYAIVHDPFFFDNMQNIFINRNKKLL